MEKIFTEYETIHIDRSKFCGEMQHQESTKLSWVTLKYHCGFHDVHWYVQK